MEQTYKYKDSLIEALVRSCKFKEAEQHAKKGIIVCSTLSVIFAVGITILGLISSKQTGSFYFLYLIVALFIPNIYTFCSDLKTVKKEEKDYNAKVQAIIELEKPENLYARLCEVLSKHKVFGEKCIVTPIEEGVCSDDLTKLYLTEKETGDKEGFTPVVLQLDNNMIENIEMNMANVSVDVSFESVFEQAKADLKEIFADSEPGEWQKFIGTDYGIEGESLDGIDGIDFMWSRFVLVRVPTSKPYDIFIYLPVGDWNDCPSASTHRAFAKHWHEQYGAVPCFISADTIMYHTPIPVGKAHAFDVAMEHAAYCPDIPLQDTETVWNLAKQLENSTFWFCWWD